MSTEVQAFFYGLACLAFLVAVIVSLVQTDGFKFSAFNWTALGLLLFVFVPFVVALRAT